jgi:hypothetical protein
MMSSFVYRKRRMRESLKKLSSRSAFFIACRKIVASLIIPLY